MIHTFWIGNNLGGHQKEEKLDLDLILWSLNLGGGGQGRVGEFLEMTNESVCIVLSAVGVGVRGWRRRRGGHLQVRTRRRRGKEEWWTFTSEDKQPLQQRGQTPFPIGALQWLLHQ